MPARRWAGIGAAPSTMTSRPSGYPLRERARPARRGRRTGSSRAAHFKDGIGERLRRLLREVVADAALDGAMGVAARELPGVGAGVRVRCAVGVALEGLIRDLDAERAHLAVAACRADGAHLLLGGHPKLLNPRRAGRSQQGLGLEWSVATGPGASGPGQRPAQEEAAGGTVPPGRPYAA